MLLYTAAAARSRRTAVEAGGVRARCAEVGLRTRCSRAGPCASSAPVLIRMVGQAGERQQRAAVNAGAVWRAALAAGAHIGGQAGDQLLAD